MNKFIFMGRLTKDPEIRYTVEGTEIANFTLAIDRRKKDEADFIPVTAFGKLADFCEKYLKKGTKIITEGTVQNNNYTDKDGNNRYGYSFISNSIEFAESKRSQTDDDGFMNVPDNIDDIVPFAR